MRIIHNYFFGLILVLLLFTVELFFFLFSDIRLILDLIPDDAAYYFKIAENFNKGFGFSFDTMHQTNGFQPLWQYIMIFLQYLFPVEPESFCRIALILQVLMSSISAFILFITVKNIKGEIQAFISLGIFVLFVFSQSLNGMESALLVFLLVIIYRKTFNLQENGGNYFLTGILCGLLVLARLDFFIFIISWNFFLLLRRDWKQILSLSSGFLILFLPYAVNNYLSTGYIEPITGVLKSSFPHINFKFDTQFTFTAFISIFTAIIAALFYIVFYFRKPAEYRNKNLLLLVLAFTIISHYLFYLFFTKWAILNYYFLFYGVFLSVIAVEFINIKKFLVPIKIFASIAVLLILLKIILNFNKNLENSWHVRAYEAAMWAKANTSAEKVFAMKDAGNFAFFSRRKVINLDGVVNDYCFQEFLKEKKLNLYFIMNNISYYILYESSASPELWKGEYILFKEFLMSYKYMQKSDYIHALKENEIYRENFAEGKKSVFIIWKMK